MAEQSIKNKIILVAENDRAMLRVLVDRFAEERVSVLGVKNGEEGLKQSLGKHPDLILLDLKMPKMNGLTMLEKLRADKWGKDVPVIVLTNLSDTGTIAKVLKIGVYDFLIKTDWKLKDVVKKVKEKLERE